MVRLSLKSYPPGEELRALPLLYVKEEQIVVGDKVKYTCKKCGWGTSIRVEWADLKPKRCMNKKCNCSFLAHKKELLIEMPKSQEIKKSSKVVKKVTKKATARKSRAKAVNK